MVSQYKNSAGWIPLIESGKPHDILLCIVAVADDHTAPAAGQAETLRRKTFFFDHLL